MTTNDPVWFSVTYAEPEDDALLRISANNDPSMLISIVHEHKTLHDLPGNGAIDGLQVQDGDDLLIVAYNAHLKIVAVGVFKVDLSLIEKLDLILASPVSSNIQMDQQRQRTIDRAITRALNEACEANTGELELAEVAR